MASKSSEKVPTVVVYRDRPSTGAAVGLISIGFSLVGIFTPLAIIVLPFALLLMLIGFIRGALSLSIVGISTSVLAACCVVLGYAYSPIALATTVALIARVIGTGI